MRITVVRKHPLSLRWNHWVNFPLMLIMIWSGLMIYWANDAYFIRGNWLRALGLGSRLATGLSWHLTLAYIFTLNGAAYLFFLLLSGHWRYLTPASLGESFQVVLHDLKIRKKPLPPRAKYNAAQSSAYFAVVLMGIGVVVTGFSIYKPIQLNWLLALCGGYEAARLEHFILMLLFVGFFFVHIGQVIRAGWPNFLSMITGVEKKVDTTKEQV
jgi:thiosulfate reductase cytochrome b subunit